MRKFIKLTLATMYITAYAVQGDEVQLDTVTTTSSETIEAAPKIKKLLKVPGSGNDPLRAIEALPGVVFGNGREAEPAVRGSSPSDNAYYLDFLDRKSVV